MRCVRNFWIETDVDGRSSVLSGGPKSAGGGFSTALYMRVDGESVRVADISGIVTDEGGLDMLFTVKGCKGFFFSKDGDMKPITEGSDVSLSIKSQR